MASFLNQNESFRMRKYSISQEGTDKSPFTVFHLINPAVFDFVRIMYHYLDIRFVSCLKQIVSYGKQSISTCCVMLKHMMCLLAAHRNCYLGDGIISV